MRQVPSRVLMQVSFIVCRSQPLDADHTGPVLGLGLFETELCARRIATMIGDFPTGLTCVVSGNDAALSKVETMNTPTSALSTKQAPTQADVDHYIAQAHKLRSDYITKALKSGLASLRGLFSHKPVTAKSAVKSAPALS